MVLLLIRCRVTRCECGQFDLTFPHCMVGAIGGKTRRDGIAAYDRVHPTGCFHGWTMGCGMRAMNPADRAGLMADSHVPLWLWDGCACLGTGLNVRSLLKEFCRVVFLRNGLVDLVEISDCFDWLIVVCYFWVFWGGRGRGIVYHARGSYSSVSD